MTTEEVLNYTKILIAAIDKQIAKMVLNQNVLTTSRNFVYNWIGTCPTCKRAICGKQNYCSECGQKLLWSNLSDAEAANLCDVVSKTENSTISTLDYSKEGDTYVSH